MLALVAVLVLAFVSAAVLVTAATAIALFLAPVVTFALAQSFVVGRAQPQVPPQPVVFVLNNMVEFAQARALANAFSLPPVCCPSPAKEETLFFSGSILKAMLALVLAAALVTAHSPKIVAILQRLWTINAPMVLVVSASLSRRVVIAIASHIASSMIFLALFASLGSELATAKLSPLIIPRRGGVV